MASRIKKNDQVIVISGKYKNQKGVVFEVFPKKDKLVIKDLFLDVKHVKSKGRTGDGQIKKKERRVPSCVVMPFCSHCKLPCRVNMKKEYDQEAKTRVCNRCKKIL
ncbi:MAG: 50S ribosomal protein L24 [Candidatus Babeliales bacterium]